MTICKSSIEVLFKDLLGEIKGFKYKITVKILLSKYKENTDREFAPDYYNSTTKAVVGPKYGLDKFSQGVFNRLDNWISEASVWLIDSIAAEYVNISIHSSLSGNSHIQLPDKLRNSMKGLINIRKNDNECFIWCHIRHLNPLRIHPDRIAKADRRMVDDLDYADIKSPVSNKDYNRIEKKNNI